MEMNAASDRKEFRRWLEAGDDDIPAADIHIVTADGRKIPAHSSVLASASPVMEGMLDRPQKPKVLRILGVPHDAAVAFLRLLYSAGCVRSEEEEEEMDRYGMHLLVLSHAYGVGWLKRACEAALASRLTAEGVVDVLQLARECDAARLYLRCMKLLAKDFASVERTEAWRFLQAHDPWLELEILQFLQEADMRKRRIRRKRAEQTVYAELGEAMDCLQHMCTEGSEKWAACSSSAACYRSLQLLVQHLASCTRRKACLRCRRMSQLLRLHSALCDGHDRRQPCSVPLCSHFKLRIQQQQQMEKKEEEDTWRLLVKKVMAARVMSSLSKRKRQEEVHESFGLGTAPAAAAATATTTRTSD